MPNSSIWSIDRTLSDATTPGQSGPGSNSSEVVLHIPQSFKIGASQSDYKGLLHSLGMIKLFYLIHKWDPNR